MPRAVLLLSGGLDSTTLLAYAVNEQYTVHAMTFRYGQRHAVEIDAARRIAALYGVRDHVIVDINLRTFGGSALTSDVAVPKDRADDVGIPITYVPARNTIFLSFALAWAEVLGASEIFIGVNALDYSGYPDCRPAFIDGFAALANLATKAAVEGQRFTVHAPLLDMTKADIAVEASRLGLDAGLSWSCYDPQPGPSHCGACDACRLRAKGFVEAGVADPTIYAVRP